MVIHKTDTGILFVIHLIFKPQNHVHQCLDRKKTKIEKYTVYAL